MNKILTACFLLLAFYTNAQFHDYHLPSKQTDVALAKLKGNVKSTFTIQWDMEEKFGEPTKKYFSYKTGFSYAKDGMTTKKTSEHSTFGGKSNTYSYDYTKTNQLERIDQKYDGKKTGYYTFKYDGSDKLVEKDEYDKNDKLIKRNKYRYNSDGKLQGITVYTGNGDFKEAKKFEWNEDNRIEEEIMLGKNDKPLKVSSYEYDSKGNIVYDDISSLDSRDKITAHQHEYVYNSKGQLVKTIFISNGKRSDNRSYEYDAQGNIIKETELWGKKKTFVYTYTYDAQGNWLTKLLQYDQFDDGKLTYILEEREIKYH